MTVRSSVWRNLIQRPIEDLKRAANIEGIRSGVDLMRDLAGAVSSDAEPSPASDQNAVPTGQPLPAPNGPLVDDLLHRSARNCHLFIVAGISGIATVVGLSFASTGTVSRITYVDLALVELLFGLGFLQQAAGNWRIRRGTPGSLVQFFRSGSSAWPRSRQEGARVPTARQADVETQA